MNRFHRVATMPPKAKISSKANSIRSDIDSYPTIDMSRDGNGAARSATTSPYCLPKASAGGA